MRKTIATPEGGQHIEMSEEEKLIFRKQREIDQAGELIKKQEEEEKKKQEEILKVKLKTNFGFSDEEISMLKDL